MNNLNWHERDHSNIEVIVPDIGNLENAGLIAYNESNPEAAENMIVQTWGYIKNDWGGILPWCERSCRQDSHHG